jgi:hypothetical protein
MALDELTSCDKSAGVGSREKLIGLYIGALAVILALCSLGGGNAAKDATIKNIEAANTWAFFQAKNARRQSLRLQADEYEILLAASPGLAPEARASIEAKIKDYRQQAEKLTTDPERQEGLDELWVKGKALESERDEALKKDPYFDYGEAFLQIAIVMASVAIISGGNAILAVSFMLGLLGIIATAGGFTLAFEIPYIG